MLVKKNIDSIIPILKKDSRRALGMKVPGFPRPYFCSFLLRDIHWFNTWASSGSTYRRRSDHTRSVYCDIRVGSYKYDQVTEGGLMDNDDEQESYSHVRVPIDDRVYTGLRIGLWRLSESKFREALSDYSSRKASGLSTIDSNKKLPSFTRVRPTVSVKYARPERVDEEKWVRFCKNASKWMSELPKASGNWVEFDASQATRILVNTERTVIVQHSLIFSLTATFRSLTGDGSHIEQDLIFNCASQKELPDMKTFKRLALRKYERLLDLMHSRKIHSFSGPVLLYPKPAGLLFHEAIGHRLEGSRLLSSGEGQTFKGQIGKRVIGVDVSIRDDPTLKKFRGQRCIGAYEYDDEGVPAQDTLLVEDGFLREFLTTRSAINSRGFASNGHARNAKFQRPISRMAVTIVEGRETYSMDELKELLIKEIQEQKKPFGMIVYQTSGGETETTSFDFQAFNGDISYATLVYPDGREVDVRGVDFVGTPLQAMNNVIAVGDEQVLENGYCGAESGFIPISTISPAILLRNLELQAKDEELVTQYILARPNI
ncbi:TldD/PmbA family protein [Oligoflexia bacterium]|nr:TldD/PmbA family protein [Oligoflexia bacterium]